MEDMVALEKEMKNKENPIL